MKLITDPRKKIVQHLVKTNTWALASPELKNISGISGTAVNKALEEMDYIEKEDVFKGTAGKPRYKAQMKNDLESFGFVFYHVYDKNDRWELLRTPYFNKILSDVINNFTLRIEHSQLAPLTLDEQEFISNRIRYPSVLWAVLCENIDIKKMVDFQKNERADTIRVSKELFSNHFRNKRLKPLEIKKLGSNFEKMHNFTSGGLTPIMQVFESLVRHDRLTIYAQPDNVKLLKIDGEYQNIIKKELSERFKKMQKYINKGGMDSLFSVISGL